jgi:5S rRNA maturation endonuclease (ribonuclease M5)
MTDRKSELDQFKRINLGEYAASRNFVVDRRASSRHSMVMRHPRGDKLIISRDASGLYYYFNAKGSDSGTIIDLVGTLDGSNLGEIRKTLRAYDGTRASDAPAPALPFNVEPATHDASGVLRAWMQMKDVKNGHPYLTEHRGIAVEVQCHPIFDGRIRIDNRGNAVFPHFGPDNTGLCGFELKNGNACGTTFTGFAPGGLKALHCSRPRETDQEAIICETAVDMLSLATIEGTEGRRFFSTAGQISSLQAACLRSAAMRMPKGSRIIIATDNDAGGASLASKIEDALRTVDIPIIRHLPPSAGDWNDVLLQTRRQDVMEMRRD